MKGEYDCHLCDGSGLLYGTPELGECSCVAVRRKRIESILDESWLTPSPDAINLIANYEDTITSLVNHIAMFSQVDFMIGSVEKLDLTLSEIPERIRKLITERETYLKDNCDF